MKLYFIYFYNNEIIITKTSFLYEWIVFWIILHQNWFLLNILRKCRNLLLQIFCVIHYSNPSKFPIPYNRSNLLEVHVLHNFTKYVSGTRVYKIVNNCLVFLICYFQVHKKWFLQNFCQTEKWMMLEIVNKIVFKYNLFAGFKTIILSSVHSLICEILTFC